MKFPAVWLITLTGCLALEEYPSNSSTPKGSVEIGVKHERKPGNIGKRALDDIYGSYSIVFAVGSPKQAMQALLDTGSSDLWVNTPESGLSPSFNPDKSDSFKKNNTAFDIRYGSGSASGEWANDVVSISKTDVKGQSIGVVGQPEAGQAIFGIGLIENESIDGNSYLNFPANMKSQGHIQYNAYSLYLDNLQASTGRVLFGGVDSGKYKGTLYTMPLIDEAAFYVANTDITVGGETMIDEPVPTLLDSGTTFTYLPRKIAERIAGKLGATYHSGTGLYFLDEKNDNQPDFTFDFLGAKINVPSYEMVIDSYQIIDGNPPKKYVLGVVPTDEAPYILGDTFLRSAYVLYDLEKKEIAIAQASYSSSSNIQLIQDSIPGTSPAPQRP